MKIVYSVGGEYSDCIVKYFDLNDFEKSLDDDPRCIVSEYENLVQTTIDYLEKK